MGEERSAEMTDTAQQLAGLQRRIQRLEAKVADQRDESVWLYGTLGVRVVALAVIVSMSTVWLAAHHGVPSRAYEEQSALSLIRNGALGDDMAVGRIALAVCLVAALALTAGAAQRWVARIAAVLGLAATLVALASKPSPVRFGHTNSWEYSWHAPAYVTVMLWLVVNVMTVTLHQSSDSR